MTNHPTTPEENPLCWMFLHPKEGVDADCHVIPENDLKEHDISSECWCRPVDDHEAYDYVWLHNAKDGREDYEIETRKSN